MLKIQICSLMKKVKNTELFSRIIFIAGRVHLITIYTSLCIAPNIIFRDEILLSNKFFMNESLRVSILMKSRKYSVLPHFIPREPGYKSLNSYNYEI